MLTDAQTKLNAFRGRQQQVISPDLRQWLDALDGSLRAEKNVWSAIKQSWQERVTTVFVRQGHYAHDVKSVSQYPPADITIERIGELLNHEFGHVEAAGVAAEHPHSAR